MIQPHADAARKDDDASGTAVATDPVPIIIDMEGVGKVFVTDDVETHALSDVDLRIRKGDFVSVAGPSGCGKSTLLSILGLLDAPSRGEYRLDDTPVSRLSAGERAAIRNRHIGFVFQAFNLIGDLTVFENVELPLTYRGLPREERERRVSDALERVGMSHRTKHYPAQLSGGQQQRVAVARALANRPSLLLADEPTGELDRATGAGILELFREIAGEGAAVVVATHDEELAAGARRRLALVDGRPTGGDDEAGVP